jgi:dimethylhistidine N-methyltransferase
MTAAVSTPKTSRPATDPKFYGDVIDGLSQPLKTLPSKYFYDAAGDKLFQDIMNSEEYYLTRCEMDIFTTQVKRLAEVVAGAGAPLALIELGPGDCTKSIHLLRELQRNATPFTYIPIDISGNVLRQLEVSLPAELPGLQLEPMNGDYFEMLDRIGMMTDSRRVVLCLGANIGNMPPESCAAFCAELASHLSPGDIAIVGFDLKKDPRVVQAAYSDRDGITREFNLNLLRRMNTELGADFKVDRFEHYSHYDPLTGASKSYLVSLDAVDVHFPGQVIHFKRDECIWMEISQKYSLEQVDDIAGAAGFEPRGHLQDQNGWFTDAIWRVR